MNPTRVSAIGAALLAGLVHNSSVNAQDADLQTLRSELTALRQQVAAQEAELRQLRSSTTQPALGAGAHPDDVRAIVREVLQDAETRASLIGPVSAGYDRGFFLRSADGNNELRLGLVGQIRYVYNHRSEGENVGDSSDRDSDGFQIRRAQVDFQGHFVDPRWTYRLRLDANNGGNIQAAWAWVGYKINDDLSLTFGQIKPSFLHEENVGGPAQLAAERSYTSDYFTTDFTQGIQLTWRASDRLKLVGTLHSGSYAARTDFNNDGTDFGLNARAEYLLVGDNVKTAWRQFGDFQSWSGDQPVVLVGAAVNYEKGESGIDGSLPDVFGWTADITAKFNGLGLFAAIVGKHYSVDGTPASGVPSDLDGSDQIGIVAQASYFLIPDKFEPFIRYEWINFDGAYYRNNGGGIQSGSRNLDDDDLSIITVGANYYLKKHNAKLTVDVLYALDPVPLSNTGQGLLRSADGDQWAVRSQFQFRF